LIKGEELTNQKTSLFSVTIHRARFQDLVNLLTTSYTARNLNNLFHTVGFKIAFFFKKIKSFVLTGNHLYIKLVLQKDQVFSSGM